MFYECVKQTLIKWLLLKRRHDVYPGSLKQNRTLRLSKGTGLRMETIYRQSLQFLDSKGNLWTRVSVGCSEKWGTKNICGKHRDCKTIVQSFSYKAYPYCSQRIGTTTYNSAQGSAQKVTIACLQNENVTETSAK